MCLTALSYCEGLPRASGLRDFLFLLTLTPDGTDSLKVRVLGGVLRREYTGTRG